MRHFASSHPFGTAPSNGMGIIHWKISCFQYPQIQRLRHLNSNMRDTERKLLVDEFNDPKSNLSVMIITYDIGSVGLNLHKACNMAVPGNSWSQEAQAYGRCLRVWSYV